MNKHIALCAAACLVLTAAPFPVFAEGMRAYASLAVLQLRATTKTRSVDDYFLEKITNETIETARLPNMEAVVDTFVRHVKAKDATAMFWLGNAYNNGQRLPKKTGEAIKWYEAAASQGKAEAAGVLYQLYKTGSDTPADYALAYKWVHVAYGLGDPNAVYEQFVFAKAPGTTTFPTLIADLTHAAAGGDTEAQYALCVIENRNIGRTGERGRARGLCAQAAAQGHVEAQALHAFLLGEKGVYGPETVSELLSAAKRGSPGAQHDYAMIRLKQAADGAGDADPEPYGWMETSAERGYAPAQFMMCAFAMGASPGDADYARTRLGYKWCYVVEAIPFFRDRVAGERYFAQFHRPGFLSLPFTPAETQAAETAARAWRVSHPLPNG